MELTTNQKQLYTIIYLMNILSNRRLGLSEDVSLIHYYPEEIEKIKNVILEKCDVDFDNIKDEIKIIEIEYFLKDYLIKLTKPYLNSDLEEEMMLLNNSIEIYKEQIDFKHLDIKIEIPAKLTLKKLGLTLSGIKSYIKNPDFIRLFEINSDKCIFCTKKIVINNKKKLLFYHVLFHQINGIIYSASLWAMVLLDYDKFEDMANSPVRIFLYLIDQYGFPIDYKNISKKLYFNYNELISEKSVEIDNKIDNGYIVCHGTKKTTSFLYGFNLKEYLSDYKRNMI